MICTNSWLLRMTFSLIFIFNIVLIRWLHLKFFFGKSQLHWIVSYYFTGRKQWSTSFTYRASGKHADLKICEYCFSLSLHRKKTCLKKALFNFENVVVLSYSTKSKCFTGVRVMPLLLCIIGASSVQKLKSNANWKVFTFTLQFPVFSHKL